VALHILWLNPANFCRLETKYRQWLAWRETEGSGLLCESLVAPVCDLADCLNTLCNEDFLCTGAAAQTGGCGCLQVDDEAAPSGSRLLFTCHCEPAPTTPPTPTDEPAGQPPKDEVTPVEPPKDEPTPVNEPADGPLVPIIDVAQPEKELPVLDVPNDTAPTAAVTEPPKDIASQSTPASVKPIKPSAADPLVQKAKPTARPVLSGGAATPPAPATTPIEGNGSRIRKRKPGYLKAITDMADGQLTSTASFELTKAFLENEPLASQYEKLVAYVIKQVIKQPAGSSDEQYWTLLRNATWHFLDKAVMDDGEHIPEPTAILLRNTFQTFRENGLDMGTLRNGWEGQVLKQILGSAVVDEYKQMMG
jgi:hypothetical protein